MTKEQFHAMTHDAQGRRFGFLIVTEEAPKRKREKPGLTIWMRGYSDSDFEKAAGYFLKTTAPGSFLVMDTRGAGALYSLVEIVKRKFPALLNV